MIPSSAEGSRLRLACLVARTSERVINGTVQNPFGYCSRTPALETQIAKILRLFENLLGNGYIDEPRIDEKVCPDAQRVAQRNCRRPTQVTEKRINSTCLAHQRNTGG